MSNTGPCHHLRVAKTLLNTQNNIIFLRIKDGDVIGYHNVTVLNIGIRLSKHCVRKVYML